MNDLCIRNLAGIIGGRLDLGSMPPLGGELEPVGRIIINCDDVCEGDLFWAIASDDCDGVCCANEAFRRGAIGVVAERHIEPWAGKYSVTVDSAQWALWQLARWHRHRIAGRVVLVPGATNSLACRLLKCVLGSSYRGSASPAVAGDIVTLAQRLLEIETTDEFALVELDSAAAESLCSMIHLCEPDFTVCRGATSALLARERELLASLPRQCRAILNGDDAHLRRAAANSCGHLVWAGRGGDCDVIVHNIGFRNGLLKFTIERRNYSVAVPGRHCLPEVLAAYTIARDMRIDVETIATAFSKFRYAPKQASGSRAVPWRVLDLTGILSTTSAIGNVDLFHDYDIEGRRVLVLGDLESKKIASDSPCRKLADSVVSISAADMFVVCGPGGETIAEAAHDAGLSTEQVLVFADVETAVRNVSSAAAPGDLIVVAGGTKMQSVVQVLVADNSSISETIQRNADRPAVNVNISEALSLASVLRETAAALPPG